VYSDVISGFLWNRVFRCRVFRRQGLHDTAFGVGESLHSGFGAEYERAHHARSASSTVDHAQVVPGHLTIFSPPHHLARSLDDVPEPARPANRLTGGKLPSVCVNRERSFIGCVHGLIKGANLALFAESGIFEADGREDGVSIVELGKLDVSRAVTCHLVSFARRDGNRRRSDAFSLPDGVVVADSGGRSQDVNRRIG